MKRILCFIDELGSGGAERQLVGLASLLKKNGYYVDVFCYHPIYFYEPLLKANNVTLLKSDISPKNYFWKIYMSYKVIRKGHYDVVIAFAPGSVAISLLIKLWYNKFKLIVSDRNTTHIISFKNRIKFNLYRLADYIVPNSYSQTNILRKCFPFMRKKLSTITNFADLKKFHPKRSEFSDINQTLKIMVAARHNVVKNVPNFILAVKEAKQKGLKFYVKWYGNINVPLYKEHAALAETEGVTDVLKFLPQEQNIEECYQEADVLCLPSLLEGFPNVIGEAMSSALPVICSDVDDNHVLVEDRVNGFLFNPNDPHDIAKAIEKICDMPKEERKRMGYINREKAEILLSPETFISKYIRLIEG